MLTHNLMIKKTQGVTLLEVILVLAISSTIILMGLGMYQRYKVAQNFNQIKSNVDQIFQLLGHYYQAYCNSPVYNPDSSASPVKTSLDPSVANKAAVIDISKYVPSNWPPGNTLVDTSDTNSYQGYYAQFNPSLLTNTPRAVYFCPSYATDPSQCSWGPAQDTNVQMLIWVSQVVVNITSPAQAQTYQTAVQATCVIDTFQPGDIVNCNDASLSTAKAQFLVWQRTPSYEASQINAWSSWSINPMIQEFKLLYTHDPMYEMYQSNHQAAAPVNNYLCGG